MATDDPTDGAKRADLYSEGVVVAYRGKKGCRSILCEQRTLWAGESLDSDEDCVGWHCPRCDEPCSIFGHDPCLEDIDRHPLDERPVK